MNKTVQEFRRENIKQLFVKVLQEGILRLEPLSVVVEESFNSDFTTAILSFVQHQGGSREQLKIREDNAKGFVDAIFKACSREFSDSYPSLDRIRLTDYRVNPIFKKIKSKMQTDAKVQVILTMEVLDRGPAEFSCTSRSILHSTLVATLEAFEFYINCERSFHKIQTILDDAKDRNRGDITQSCVSDLSKLTEVNTYEKKRRD
ncbi:MAG: hypothetical protein CMA72_09050 [Euryarchaeota archaeon]|nr:hypothetical protein [Euryarchaeota archaeon]